MTSDPDHKWRNTILAGLANYIDAGSIVAGSVALALWRETYGLSDSFIGLIERNNLPEWTATMLPASYFLIGMVSIFGIFMTLADRVNQRLLFGISAVLHVVGMGLLAVFGFKLEVVIAHVVIMGIAAGFGAQSFFQLWSAELFPTAIRSTAQGLTFAIVRIGLGIWSLAVPTLAAYDFTTLAWILTGFLVVSGVIGLAWAPRNEGQSLEQIAARREASVT